MRARSFLLICPLLAPLLPQDVPGQSMEDQAFQIEAAVERFGSREIWPGYDPTTIPLAIFDGARTWLFRHPSPPPEFRSWPGEKDVWVTEYLHTAVRANSTTALGGVQTATLLLPSLMDFPSVADRAGVAIHEAFHAYQQREHPQWGPGSMGLENPATDARLLAFRRLETALLRRAVNDLDMERSASLAAAALEVRRQRFDHLPASMAAFERGLELMEGTAQHVQVTATGSRTGLMPLPEEGFGPEATFMRSYSVGLALVTLLERFDPDWEMALERGQFSSLDAALAAAIEEPAADWREDLPAALRQAEEDVRRLVATRDSLRDAFLSQDGWRVILTAPESAPLQLRNLDPANLTSLGGSELLHTRWLRVGHEAGEAEVLDRNALTLGRDGEPLANGFLRLTVTGLAARPMVEDERGDVLIRGEGFEGEFHGVSIEWEGRTLWIRLPGGQ